MEKYVINLNISCPVIWKSKVVLVWYDEHFLQYYSYSTVQ